MAIGITEIAVISIIALLLFGPKRIPELAQAYKKAKRIIKQETDEIKSEFESVKEKPEEYKLKDDVKNPEV